MSRRDEANGNLPEDIFNDAVPLDRDARAAFLEARCGDDAELRHEIEKMLAIADRHPQLLDPPVELQVPGRVGRYELMSECGRGGMGIVYRARDTKLDRFVALKVLPAHLAYDADRLERFEREARTLAALNNERIATLYSMEESDGIHFLTMEFVDGKTLADTLGTGKLSQRRSIAYCHSIACALEVAHQQNIIHRDLKPANVMITANDEVKVLDFGIARTLPGADTAQVPAETEQPLLTSLLGTPAYMSPEQFAGRPIDRRSDIWSFGCILFECLTGRRLFAGPQDTETREAEVAQALAQLSRSAPRRLTSLVASCLETDPNERVDSIGDVREQLGRMLDRQHAWKRRLVWIAGAAAVAIGVIAIVMTQSPRVNLASVEIRQQRTARALDKQGNTIWIRQFEGDVGPNIYRRLQDGNYDPQPHTIVADGERSEGVVLATYPATGNATLWYLRASDGEAVWQRHAQWVSPMNESGPLYYRWSTLVAWPGLDSPVVAAMIRDDVWYSSAVQFITLENALLGTYYHPGILFYCCQETGTSGRQSRIVLYGTNSSARFLRRLVPFETRMHCGVVAMLDLPSVDGQAFPYSEGLPEARDWPGMPRAAERAYLVIPPLHPDHTSEVFVVRSRASESGASSAFEVGTLDGRFYQLDAELRPQSCFTSVNSPADSLRRVGKASFPPLLYIESGSETLVDVPLRF